MQTMMNWVPVPPPFSEILDPPVVSGSSNLYYPLKHLSCRHSFPPLIRAIQVTMIYLKASFLHLAGSVFTNDRWRIPIEAHRI